MIEKKKTCGELNRTGTEISQTEVLSLSNVNRTFLLSTVVERRANLGCERIEGDGTTGCRVY